MTMMLRLRNNAPQVVAISGIAGSGKTTIAKALAQKWNATAIYWDDFDELSSSPDDYVEWFESGCKEGGDAWRYPLLADVLNRLTKGESPICPVTQKKLNPTSLIIFDAPLGRSHEETAPFISYLVHLDTPLDVALSRRVLRDYSSSHSSVEILEALQFYLERSRPLFKDLFDTKGGADLVLSGLERIEVQMAMIEANLGGIRDDAFLT